MENNYLGVKLPGSAEPSINTTAKDILSKSEALTSQIANMLAYLDGGGPAQKPNTGVPVMPILSTMGASSNNLSKADEMLCILERKIFG